MIENVFYISTAIAAAGSTHKHPRLAACIAEHLRAGCEVEQDGRAGD
ncbi:MAG: hypothetical protein MIO93_16865 [ANME-2 cluster archaeon]|nr:hypothetical protein [ANME-2 cluster archaeon]